ncbi:MAG: MoaD/ThiS family protein [Rhodospirillaceae bacterium]|jgi:sulfur carrier protein ThiS|nr:MoaD/ThiS family protein [Rhodospirillaceae bacterium]MBT5300029.1 MoaD/ThiS family protein [Rhodospirillaceae bacterium]MBT5515887.1 MoaD/ThiS family protein [Rhodospirillaceae bacterium]MBT6084320.1 MoaD/ThiS family protein [Rhodospirillaceae bacterium]MBT6607011.1 MoaD/ThiS family protein [Rhodospirillaceae bacterium]
MKIKVKLLAAGGAVPKVFDEFGECELDMPASTSIADLMDKISLPKEESYTSLVSGQAVQAEDRAAHTLGDGDEVVLLPAIQGG